MKIIRVSGQTKNPYSIKEQNRGIIFDLESPIYVFITSNKIKPEEIEWTEENIEKFKKAIGYFTEIYSGQWEDYSESLYDRRIEIFCVAEAVLIIYIYDP